MAEFVLKSRKNETTNPDFALEKLEKPGDSKLFEFFESKVKDIRPGKSRETPKNTPGKNDKTPETVTAPALNIEPEAGTVPRLPWQLERLVSAAASNQLPQGTVKLSSGLVPDLNLYTLGWAAAYLTSDRADALSRLWQVRYVWQNETPS